MAHPKYKMIVSDLDETLLDAQGRIPSKNIQAIQKARELGVRFVPATGRGYRSVHKILDAIGLREMEREYVISFNGGAVTENKGERLLSFQEIPFQKAEELYCRGLSYDVCIHVYTKDTVYAYRLNKEEKDHVEGRLELQEIFTDRLDFLKGQKIVKILYQNTDCSYLNQIEEDLKPITADIDVSYSSNRYIEFNRKGINKGFGMLFLADLLHIRPEEIIAIGDNYNDLSMIQAAGLGAGVCNTVPEMKPLCDYVTNATNDEGAIAEIIEKFIL